MLTVRNDARTAHEIAEAVRSRRITARDVAVDALARVAEYDQVQPQAWICRFTDDSIVAAAEALDLAIASGADLPLAGVPFAVKDNVDVAGIETTAACPEFAYLPDSDAHVVARLRSTSV